MLIAIFMRHGQKPADGEDRLTDAGHKQVFSTAIQLKDRLKLDGLQPDAIFYSPAKRTSDSARILSDVFRDCTGMQFERSNSLKDGTRGEFTGEELQNLDPRWKTVICVSHNQVIQSQFSILKKLYEAIDAGSAIRMDFSEDSWSEIDRDTLPLCIENISPA